MKKINKRKIAGLLATCMVSTILSPAMPVYAANYGENVKMTFNTGDGPGVELHHSTWSQLTMSADTDGSTLATLTGKAGYLLSDAVNNPVSSQLQPVDLLGGGLVRPDLPDWSTPVGGSLDSSWTGYVFDGWYTAAGTKLEYLHPAFRYEDLTYYARWTGNPSEFYDFEVEHYADINGTQVEFYDTGVVGTVAGTTISTSYKRTIPGYKFEGTALGTDYDYQPRSARKYGQSEGAGTGKNVGTFNSSYVFNGTMPNDKLLVSYKYVPNPDQKFNFRVEHLNSVTNTAIASAQVTQKAVGNSISAAPVTVTGYVVSTSVPNPVEITAGNTDNLSGNGTYGATSTYAGGSFTGNTFAGAMPNQAVTITYYYDVDPTATSSVTVSYVDDQGRDLVDEGIISEQTLYTVGLGAPVVIPVPSLTSQGYQSGVNLSWNNLNSAVYNQALNQVDAQTNTGAGTLTIQYVVNQSDTNSWARLTFLSGANGSLQGDSSPQILAKNSAYTINADGTATPDFTGGFTPLPDSAYYMGDGWYRVNSSGTATGSKLTDLTLTGDTKIMYCFIEDPAQWVDIRFASGGNGTISTTAAQHLKLGTSWNSSGIQIPSATASSGYMFAGWYDQMGTLAWDGQSALPGTQFTTTTYTAKFVPIVQETGYDAMNRPDAAGALASDGSGVITVSNPTDNRRYIVTDMDGTVLAELTSSQINGGSVFGDLTPGSSYNVYEISVSAPALTPGSSTIADVTSALCSYPTRVILPAVDDNVTVENDVNDSEKAQIVIRPAADDMVYALLDEAGNEVYGWTSPSGSPLEVIFGDLDPDTHYTVVVKDATGSESPADKKDYGTDVYTEIDTNVEQKYVIQVLGGSINTVNGVAVGASEYQVKAGVAVQITAPMTDASGQNFKQWKVLVGTLSGFTNLTQRTRTITMPAKNVVLAAIYEDDLLATPSSASMDYKVNSGHEGEVALDMSQDKLGVNRAAVTTAEDQSLIGAGRTVTYRVQFTKRSALATESNAVKAERSVYEDAFKAAFALDVELLRFVDGQSRPVAAGTDPGPIDIFLQIDAKDLEHLDYQLWQIHADGQVDEITPLDPDPNSASEYGGLFLFTGEINSLYVLSYSKTNEVTLKDPTAGNDAVFKVRHGEGLSDSDDYAVWAPVDPYTDASGFIWTYAGLSTRSGRYEEVDETDPIKKNKTIYTYYESDEDDWNQAREQLIEEIQTADDLMNNGGVSQENKDRLQAAIDEAEAVLNQHPRSTTEELVEAYEKLKDVVDSIRNSDPTDPDDPTDPSDPTDPTEPTDPGKNKGGGGGGSSSSSIKRPTTYKNGVDGNWQLIDADNHSWVFVLTSGSRVAGRWAIVEYTHEGSTISYYYHFDADGVMNHGWFLDTDGRWYYLDVDHDGWFGHMKTGWHLDPQDQRWYYLDPGSGAMTAGWKKLGDQWYYFNPEKSNETWEYDDTLAQWEYLGTEYRPYGSMYVQEATPDGHNVNGDGVWID